MAKATHQPMGNEPSVILAGTRAIAPEPGSMLLGRLFTFFQAFCIDAIVLKIIDKIRSGGGGAAGKRGGGRAVSDFGRHKSRTKRVSR